MKNTIYTALDANLNRAMEGIRVCEDILRFALHSSFSVEFKELRHSLRESSKVFPRELLIRGRDVEKDEQKFVDLESEKNRTSLQDLFGANLHRAVQAVRSLEELSKLEESGGFSGQFQKIRFTLYTLEKKVLESIYSENTINKMDHALYAILDSAFVRNNDYSGTALRLINGGASIIQLRMKSGNTGSILSLAKELAALCRERDVLFIVNDHPDIAVLSGAHGLHLGQDEIPVSEARKLLPNNMIIGISTHSPEQAEKALEQSPDYIAIGPIFGTTSKTADHIPGIGSDVILQIKEKINMPIVAIGGITPDNVPEIIRAGCFCPAIISALYKDDAIEENCREFVEALS
ncbi:MAG: thiamine phosphate synthase [bacterium]|nr:thiamine phosphate synthase [bacterium]